MEQQVWYYESNGRQEPTTLGELRRMYQEGRVSSATLVWREGMDDWIPAGQAAELRNGSPGDAGPERVAPFNAPVGTLGAPVGTLSYSMPHTEPLVLSERALDLFRQTRPWVRVFSLLLWISAGLMLLAGLGMTSFLLLASSGNPGSYAVIVGPFYVLASVLYIMPALYLTRYARRLGEMDRMRRADLLEQAIEAQKSFWKFVGICIVVLFCFWILMALIGVAGAFMR